MSTLTEKISATQALNLHDYFKTEQRGGNYLGLDFTDVNWLDVTQAQKRRIWHLIFNKKKEELIKMLFSLGAKIEQ